MDLKSILVALRHCGRVQAFKHGKSFHCHLIKYGVSHDLFMANNLISMYGDFAFLNDAQKLFDEMLDRNVVTWTTMVSACTSCGRPYEGLKIYTQMLETSETPNGFMYSAVLKACGLAGDLELGRSVHKRVSNEKLEFDTVLMNTLLDMYVKFGSLGDAKKVFNEILYPNSTSWNTIMSGYCRRGLMDEAVKLFYQMPEPNVVSWNSIIAGFSENGSPRAMEFVCMMHSEGVKLDEFTFPCALKNCSFHCCLAMGTQIHCCVLKVGLDCHCFTMSALVEMYSNCNTIEEAEKLFDQFSISNNFIGDRLALWNSMLSGYVLNERNGAAMNVLSQMYCSGACIDSYTFSSALKVCINFLNLRLGLQVHGLVVTSGYELNCVVGSVLIDLYAKLGNVTDALALFHRLPEKDIMAWSGLIMGCAQMGFNSLAFTLFRDMVNLDLEVDQFVISSILKVCSNLASIVRGKQVHACCVKNGYEMEGVTATSLIDMYSKCGEIENSLVLFDCTPQKDIVSWTGIITGCGQNGRAKEAINLFHQMIKFGLQPNEVTFLGVLSACRHAGLVDEAWSIFRSMKSDYGLDPHLEHYYCVVDLLGQAGRFKEVENLITNMPIKPDKTIWGSLLGACGTHRNTEMVNFIAEQLFKNSPEDPSIYVMLSNVYATLGMWDSLSKVREAVKTLGIKVAGKSWIEIQS